jgi:hypothetical protein
MWSYDFADQLGFRLYHSNDNVTYTLFDTVAATVAGTFTYNYAFAPTGNQYYRVSAYNQGGEGDPVSNGPVAQPTCIPSPTPTVGATPTKVQNVHTTSQGGTGTFLTWDLNPTVENITTYHVYRYKGNSTNADLIASPVAPPQDIASFLGGGKTSFAVSAENAGGEGVKSDKHTVQKH